MIDDPILTELRKHKAAIAKEYNYDVRLIAEAAKKAALEAGYELVDRTVLKAPKPEQLYNKSLQKTPAEKCGSHKSDVIKFLEDLTGGPLTLRKLLRSLRLFEGMTQAQFAEKLQVSPYLLSQIERGRKAVTVEQAQAFAKVLGHSETQFVRLCLEWQLEMAGLNYTIKIEAGGYR